MRAVKTRDLSDAMLLKYKKQIDDEIARRFAARNEEANQFRDAAYGVIPPTSSEISGVEQEKAK